MLADDQGAAAGYTPSPYSPGWEVWVGFAAGVIPFLIGGYEFTKRIVSLSWPLDIAVLRHNIVLSSGGDATLQPHKQSLPLSKTTVEHDPVIQYVISLKHKLCKILIRIGGPLSSSHSTFYLPGDTAEMPAL